MALASPIPAGGMVFGWLTPIVVAEARQSLELEPRDATRVILWDPKADKLTTLSGGPVDGVVQLAWSPDGATIAATDTIRTLHFWSRGGKPEDGVTRVWSRSGDPIVAFSASEPGFAHLAFTSEFPGWVGNLVQLVARHPTSGYLAAWRPDGLALAAAAAEGAVRLLPTESELIYLEGVAGLKLDSARVAPEVAKPVWDPLDVDAWIGRLSATVPSARRKAAYVLGRIGPPAKRFRPELLKALADKAPSVRGVAALALCRIAPDEDEVVQAIVDAARRDNDWSVRLAAIEALGAIPTRDARAIIPTLIAALSDDRLWTAAGRAFIGVGEEALPALVAELRREDAEPTTLLGVADVITQVARARAANVGAPPVADEVLNDLRKTADDGSDLRRVAAMSALWELSSDAEFTESRLSSLLGSPDTTMGAKVMAARLAGTAATRQRTIVMELGRLLRSDSPLVSAASFDALEEIGWELWPTIPPAPPRTIKMQPNQFLFIASALSVLGRDAGVLIADAQADPRFGNDWWYDRISRHLDLEARKASAERLAERVREGDERANAGAFDALGDEGAEALAGLLGDANPEIARRALDFARPTYSSFNSRIAPKLEALMDDGPAPLRVDAAGAFARVAPEEAAKRIETFQAWLDSGDPALRLGAVQVVGTLAWVARLDGVPEWKTIGEAARSMLHAIETMEKDPDTKVAEAAQKAVKQIRAIPPLVAP